MEEVINTPESPETLFQRGTEALEAKKYREAFTDLSRAAEANYAPALHLLGRMYQGHQGIPEDRDMAAECFRKGAALNHKECKKMLEIYYQCGFIPLDVDYAARYRQDWEQLRIHGAHKHLKKLVKKTNDFSARYHLTMINRDDKKLRKLYNSDPNTFFQEFLKDTLLTTYWRRSCLIFLFKHEDRLSYENHKILVEELYLNEINIKTEYPHRDMTWLLNAATHGDVDAQFNLGVICINGENGFEKNTSMAKKYFNLAAEQDHIDAQYHSAFLADDEFEKAKWFHRAAKNGDKDAQYNMGCALSNGEGIARDDTKAAKWFRRAAKQGDEKAKENIQLLYKEKRILFNSDDIDHYRYDYKTLKIAEAKPYLHDATLPIAHYRSSIAKLEARMQELTPDEWFRLHTHRFNLAHIYLSEGYSKHSKNEAMEYLANIPKDHEKFAEAQRLFEKYKFYNQNGQPLTTFYPTVRNVDAQPQEYNAVTLATLVENTNNMNNIRRG